MNIRLIPELSNIPSSVALRAFYVNFKPISRTVLSLESTPFVEFPRHRFEIYVVRYGKTYYQLYSLYFQVYGRYTTLTNEFHNIDMPNIDYGHVCLGRAIVESSWKKVIENSTEAFWTTQFGNNDAFSSGQLKGYAYHQVRTFESVPVQDEKEFESLWKF